MSDIGHDRPLETCSEDTPRCREDPSTTPDFESLAAIAANALELRSEQLLTAARCDDPWPHLPRRIVPNVLRMPARELGDPVPFVVLMESDDWTLHISRMMQRFGDRD